MANEGIFLRHVSVQSMLAGGAFATDNALFLKVFANEVLNAFEESNVMKELHTVRTISSGKSAQFPVTGIATAKYHTPGAGCV